MNGRRFVSLIYCVAQYTSISFLFDYYHLSNVVRVLCHFVDANSTLINELHSYIARALILGQLYRVRAAATNVVDTPHGIHCVDIRDEFIKCINIQFITGTREKTNITQHAITRAYERKPVQLLIILFLMASHG